MVSYFFHHLEGHLIFFASTWYLRNINKFQLTNSFASLGKKFKFPLSLQAMSSIQTYYQQIIFNMKKINNQNEQNPHNFEK